MYHTHFEPVGDESFTPANSIDHEFLQIFVSHERVFRSRWHPGELWRYSYGKDFPEYQNRKVSPRKKGKLFINKRGSEVLNLATTQELQYITSQNDTVRGSTNYYRTGNIRFNEEKGCDREP